MEKSRHTKFVAVFIVLALIFIGVCGVYLFSSPDGWISVEYSGYSSSSPPPADAVVLIPTDQDYQQYPRLKAILENPGADFPISDNLIVRLVDGGIVVSGQEAGVLLDKYGMYKNERGYIFSQNRYYNTVLIVT